ncbi:MAG TPA: AAA family ATPase, partial [Roseiflexaceae bacterium]|nr:AAA family ATPase [Roseiflexaceae bacterium]
EENEISERTVRNVLRAYAEGGLESLRSRRISAARATTPAEQALIAALEAEPQAGGDRLWRLAQELMGEDGAALSRRTAYRILARLRADEEDQDEDEDEDAPNSLRALVRAALPLLAEDPPLTLGASQLAQQLLPGADEALPRGVLLQQAIREALDHLRPPGVISAIDRSWWPYLICTGEYEAGQRRAELQDDLALSASTYSRAKRQGIDAITALLPQLIAERTQGPAALSSQRLPRTVDFIGRRDEESYYTWRLQTEGIGHIWGLPGSGKTALAAELAAEGVRYGQTVLWHTCHAGPDAGLLGIIRGLAKALAAAGDDLLEREMRRAPVEDQDPRELLNLLRERLLVHPSVIVLDDIHRADPQDTELLYDALADLVARRSTRLLLVGRGEIESLSFPPLQGLSERDARILWGTTAALSAEQWWALYETTGGLPALLRLVAATYRRAGDRPRPEDWSVELAAWVHDEIWSRLDLDEQRLLATAQTLHPHPWADHAAQVCEALGIVPETFAALRGRALLTINRAVVVPFSGLREHVETFLAEQVALREQVEALAVGLENAAPSEHPVAEPTVAPAVAPAGLELIERVREALHLSAAYLQEQQDDQVAHQLAAELALLQGALPDPAGPPPTLARTLGESERDKRDT